MMEDRLLSEEQTNKFWLIGSAIPPYDHYWDLGGIKKAQDKKSSQATAREIFKELEKRLIENDGIPTSFTLWESGLSNLKQKFLKDKDAAN